MLVFIGGFACLSQIGENFGYIGMLAAVTVAVALGANDPTFSYALERSAELIGGVIIAMLVSRFVFPIHAKKKIKSHIANILADFATLHQSFTSQSPEHGDLDKQAELENKIIKELGQQSALLKEALLESKKVKYVAPLYQQILFSERKLLRSLYMLRQTISATTEVNPYFVNISEVIKKTLEDCSQALAKNQQVNSNHQLIITALDDFVKNTCETDHDETRQPLLFCLRHIAEVLKVLEDQVNTLNHPN